MSEIKYDLYGLTDYEAAVNRIDAHLMELGKIETQLYQCLNENEWQGEAKDRCKIIFMLSKSYRIKISSLLKRLNYHEKCLHDDINNFMSKSNVVKKI